MEPTYTETRSSRPRWSAVDTLIVILVLVALAGIAFRIVHAVREDAPVGEEAMYMVYFTVAETHEDVLDEVRRFDAVYLLENDVYLGNVGAYRDEATGEYHVALTQTPVISDKGTNRATAAGCLFCPDGILRDESLLVGNSGVYLTPGSVLTVRTDRVVLTLTVTEIRPREQ